MSLFLLRLYRTPRTETKSRVRETYSDSVSGKDVLFVVFNFQLRARYYYFVFKYYIVAVQCDVALQYVSIRLCIGLVTNISAKYKSADGVGGAGGRVWIFGTGDEALLITTRYFYTNTCNLFVSVHETQWEKNPECHNRP